MKLNKVLKTSLAMALVFGSVTVLTGCGKDKDSNPSVSKEETEQYEIYKLALESGYNGTYEEWLASIRGAKGDKGDKGNKGDKGDTGDPGENGSTWFSGVTDPEENMGNNGDFYYNSESKKIFKKEANIWKLITIIEDGTNGVNGTDGRDVEFRTFDNYIQWRYKTSDNSDSWKNLVDLSTLKGIDGVDGTNGAIWLYGKVDPSENTKGNVGDFYLNTNTYDVFTKDAEVGWKWLCNLKGGTGSKGEEGKKGATWIFGNSKPTDDTEGIFGDVYMDISTNNIYSMNELGEWIFKCNLTGQTGEKGETGEKGTDGLNGSDGREVEFRKNDMYIQWRYKTDDDSEEWQNLVDLDSLKGNSGKDGIDGVNGVDGENGKDGREVEFKTENNTIMWRYKTDDDSEEWILLFDFSNLKGEDGKDGKDGKDGINGENGKDGKDGLTVVDVSIVSDKWGINTTYKFIMSDGSSISRTIKNVIPNDIYYACSSEEEFKELLSLGVSKIRLIDDIKVTSGRYLAVLDKENMIIDLNGFSITPDENVVLERIFSVESNNEYDVNITIKNGTIGSSLYNETSYNEAGISVFGGGYGDNDKRFGKLTLNIENVTSYGTVYGLATTATWYNADIKANNSKFIAIYRNDEITVDDFEKLIDSDDESVKKAKIEAKKLGAGAFLPANNTNEFTNCEFYGPTGVYIKGGKTKFTNTRIIADGKKLNFVEYTGGFYPTGSALVAESSYNYSIPVEIEINGGQFESFYNELIQKINNVTEGLNIVGEETAILANRIYKVSTKFGVISAYVTERNKVNVIDNKNIKIDSYKILTDGTVDVSINAFDEETNEWSNIVENYTLFNSSALINTDLLKEIYGTYNNFYLNEGVLTYDSLKLNTNGTYKLHLKENDLNEDGVFSVVSMTDSEYVIKTKDKTITINAYTNSFTVQ